MGRMPAVAGAPARVRALLCRVLHLLAGVLDRLARCRRVVAGILLDAAPRVATPGKASAHYEEENEGKGKPGNAHRILPAWFW